MKKQDEQTAQLLTKLSERFRVTHPFHPFYSKEFEVLRHIRTPRRNEFVFIDEQGRRRFIPVAWTDAFDEDPFVVLSAGRSYFRIKDLLRLCELVNEFKLKM